MDAQRPPAQTSCIEDLNLLRMISIYKDPATKVFHFLFKIGSSNRPSHMSLFDYYTSNGIQGFERGLFEEQRQKITADPGGSSFNITLLYRCLRNGSHGLADMHDENWRKDDGASVESLLTLVKNKRNHLAHRFPMYSYNQLLSEANELKDILIKIIQFSCSVYNIPSDVIELEIAGIESKVFHYLYENFESKTLQEYKDQLYFEAQSEYINGQGVEDLLDQYDRYRENEVAAVNHLVDLKLPLDEVYTEMRLLEKLASGENQDTSYEEILQGEEQKKTDALIVISGDAGIGKTTFTKKVLLDWRQKQSEMKYLVTHDLILKIECRNTSAKSFYDMLLHLMPKVSRSFKPDKLQMAALAQNVLVILDGLDELNESMVHLFDELLHIKENHGLSLMVTTRPEKLKDIEEKVKCHQIKTKHIQLLGVSTDKTENLVTKYHHEISKSYPAIQEIKGLLNYLKRTQHRLADLWRFPYNLSLLVTLWAYNYLNLTNIITAAELYREILELHRSKLKECLRLNKANQKLSESERNWKVDFFLCSLAKESFIGLVNDNVHLTQEAYQNLEDICRYLDVPILEMLNTFLKCTSGSEGIYSFPHKGQQDYLAAYYIWLEITGRKYNYDSEFIVKGITSYLGTNHVHSITMQRIVEFVKTEMKGKSSYNSKTHIFLRKTKECFGLKANASFKIHRIMEEIQGFSKYDLTKFQNMLICLIGMFYSEVDMIDEQIKLEALQLLQKTGVWDKASWITLLNSVKCDEYVALFISRQEKILEGHIQITDSSVSAYISLMQVLKPPLKNASKITVDINIKGELIGAQELLQLISSHQFRIKRILVNDNNVREYAAMLKVLRIPLLEAHKTEVCLEVNRDLSSMKEVTDHLQKNNFTTEINDSNLSEYISFLRSSPLQKNKKQISIALNVKGNIENAGELLELVYIRHFKLKRFLVNEANFMQYTETLKALKMPLKDTSEIETEVFIDEDITSIRDLVKEIAVKNVCIKKFQVRDFQIDDSNLMSYISILKDIPPLAENANLTSVEIVLKGDHKCIDELLKLIGINQFKVKKILITDQNYRAYYTALKDLTTPLTNAHEVNIDIQVGVDLPQIKYLLHQIRENNFQISNLEMIRDVTITDCKVHETIDIMRNLPVFTADAHKGRINIDISEETSDTASLLLEVSRNKFRLDRCRLFHAFRHPASLSAASINALSEVFHRCSIEKYRGPIAPHLSLPLTISELAVNVLDTSSYLQLIQYLETTESHKISFLALCMSLEVAMEALVPIPGDIKYRSDLYFPDLSSDEDILKASTMARLLNPTNGHKMLARVFFPRCKLDSKGIERLILRMKGVSINGGLFFPTSCRPFSDVVEKRLQDLAKEVTHCTTEYGIVWGKLPYWTEMGIVNMDSWWKEG